jgi:hypothetical protein
MAVDRLEAGIALSNPTGRSWPGPEILAINLIAENQPFDSTWHEKFRCNRHGRLMAGLRQCCHQFACRIPVIQLNRPAPHQRKLKRNPDRRVVADSVEKLGFPRCSLSPQKNDLHKPRAPNERRPHRAKPPARLACKTRFRPPESENQPRSAASLRRGRPRDLLTTGRISSE